MSWAKTERVSPIIPTILPDRDSLPYVQAVSIPVNSFWILPGLVDAERFKGALRQALHDYPHAAGRLREEEDEVGKRWILQLTNDGIPVTIASSDVFITESMMQQDRSHVLDSISTNQDPEEWSTVPLVKIKVVTWNATGETTLGVAWNHVLGDGSTLLSFVTSISDYYQGGKPRTTPTFEEFLNPRPIVDKVDVEEMLPLIAEFKVEHDKETALKMWSDSQDSTARIDLVFNAEQLGRLKVEAQTTIMRRISTQDALIAYIIIVLSKVSPVPIERAWNHINVRGVPRDADSVYTPPPSTSVGNVLVCAASSIPYHENGASIGSVASAIRDSIENIRKPEVTRKLMGIFSDIKKSTIRNGRKSVWIPPQNTVFINSQSRWPAGSAHFGYLGRTRFHRLDGALERQIRVWPANPVKLNDGSWKTYEGGVNVTFSLSHDLKPKFMDAILEDGKADCCS